MDGTPPAEGGLFATLARMVKTLRDVAENRLELFLVELKEERIRFFGALVLAAVGFGSALMAVMLFTLLVILAFWETHRLLVVALLALAYSSAAIVIFATLRSRLHQWRAFGSTLEQIKKDRSCLEEAN